MVPVGLFETVRCVGGVLQRWPAHHARLAAGCARLGLPTPPDALTVDGDAKVNVFVRSDGWSTACAPLPSPFQPVSLDVARRPPGVRDLKTMDRTDWEPDGREVVWVEDGLVRESSRANLFVVRRGVIWTAPADGSILPGVTRAAVMAHARRLGIGVIEAPVAFGGADEVFSTSALRLVAPVTRIGDRIFAGWGPISRLLAGLMAEESAQIGILGRTRSSV